MKRILIAVLLSTLLVTGGVLSACQKMVDVQNGTRVVDSQGNVISSDVKTIRVPADKAGAYRVVTITKDASGTASVSALYDTAQRAIASGDTSAALTSLSAVMAIDPNYGNAKAQSDALKAGKKVTPDTNRPGTTPGKPTTPTKPTTPGSATENSALTKWLPDTIDGFTAQKALIDPLEVSRQYDPKAGSPAAHFVIVADQYSTKAAAGRALDFTVRQKYPKDAETIKVNGHTAFFSTDGKNGGFAVLGFVDGASVVALEMQTASGSPSALKSALVKAMSQLP
jgi:hypothetical protein